MNASSTARFDREPQECAFGAGFRPLNLGIEWNADNQLKKVLKNAATIATFAYDPAGRRVEKVSGGTTTTFTYDRVDILRETASATTIYYVHGPGIDEPLAKEVSGSVTYYHADGLGSVLKLSNAAGTVTHEYRYDSYGRLEIGFTQGSYAYTGREWDPEIGSYYYRARYYDPYSGRFLSEDPVAFSSGSNFYSQTANNPVNWVDPFGLEHFVLLVGDPGKGAHNVGTNFMRAAETRAASLVSQGHTADIARVSSVTGFNAAITSGGAIDGGIVYFGHGGGNVLFIGEEAGDDTNLVAGYNVNGLNGEFLRPGATVELNSCYSARGENSIASALAEHLNRTVIGHTGPMAFSGQEGVYPHGDGARPPESGPIFMVTAGATILVQP